MMINLVIVVILVREFNLGVYFISYAIVAGFIDLAVIMFAMWRIEALHNTMKKVRDSMNRLLHAAKVSIERHEKKEREKKESN